MMDKTQAETVAQKILGPELKIQAKKRTERKEVQRLAGGFYFAGFAAGIIVGYLRGTQLWHAGLIGALIGMGGWFIHSWYVTYKSLSK